MALRLCAAFALLAMIGACGQQSEQAPVQAAQTAPPPQAANTAAAPTPPQQQQVTIKPAVSPPPEPVAPSLASGRFGKAGTWSLVKVKATGAILSVEFQIDGADCDNSHVSLDEVSHIDEVSAKKFGVLKDEGGQWLAGPLSGKSLWARACGGSSNMWIKFPAPPPESKTITLNLAQLGTFDGIAVRR